MNFPESLEVMNGISLLHEVGNITGDDPAGWCNGKNPCDSTIIRLK